MIDYEGEQYVTASEVARRFNIARGTCYNNILCHMQECYLPGRKNALYRLSDVEQHAQVRVVEKMPQPLTLVSEYRNISSSTRFVANPLSSASS